MVRNPSLATAIGVSLVVAVLLLPPFGWPGALPAGFTAFYVVALIGSGFRAVRAVGWGVLVAGLLVTATQLPAPAAQVLAAVGLVLFYAGALVPGFRRRWFGQSIE